MAFCPACGTAVVPGTTFCSNCGGRVVEQDSSQPMQVSNPPKPGLVKPIPSTASNGGCGKLVLARVLAVLLIGAIVVGGAVYLGYKAKNRIGQIKQEIDKQNSTAGSSNSSSTLSALDKLLGSKSDSSTNPEDIPGSLEPGKPLADNCPNFSGEVPATPPYSDLDPANIPLKAGMTLIDSWHRFNGDVEATLTVTSVEPSSVNTETTGIGFANDREAEGRKHTTSRTVCRTDLENGHYYQTEWGEKFPAIFPDTTQYTIPTQLFQQLKSSGKASWGYVEYTAAGDRGVLVRVPCIGDLLRVEPQDVPYDVIVNDQLQHLPTIHVKGSFSFSGDAKVAALLPNKDSGLYNAAIEAYILDNPGNPICLLFRKGPEFQIRFIKIIIPQEIPSRQIEQQLKEKKKAITYGINFDFNKDTIKPESEAVLKEIAQAMADNPDWKLTITGHTDNIGGDKYNLDLSQRRSAAVKRALVERYHEDPNRLSTAGRGDSSPLATNDTLEGRARNRRVELTLE